MFSFMTERSRRGHHYQLARKTCTVNTVLHSFPFQVVRVWNELSVEIAEAEKLSTFKTRLSLFELRNIADLRY